MTPAEAAARLRLPADGVAEVTEVPGGHVAHLADGDQVLITGTVCRPYVPDVDGAVAERVTEVVGAEPEPEPDGEPGRVTEPAPAPPRRPRTRKKP